MSKYPYFKLIGLALDGITSFSTVPLRLAIWMGFAVSATALLGVVYAFAVRLLSSSWPSGWASLFVTILFIGGVQLLSLGIIGEYVGRIHTNAKWRPLYLVAESLGWAKRPVPPATARNRGMVEEPERWGTGRSAGP